MSESHPPEGFAGAVGAPVPLSAPPKCCSGAWFAAAAFVLFLYVLDQATKLWTAGLDLHQPGWLTLPQHVELGDHILVIPGVFHWVHFSNTGAAFGVMQDSNRFFIGLSIAAFTGLLWALRRNLFPGKLNFAAVLLLLSGILGNFTDRLLHGYVVDFLFFDFGFAPFNPWPAFNVADSCICVAVGLLLLVSLQEMRPSKPNQ
ncbi:MAG: signal peptidase II [Verrucomicrobia bacterium]|nr:MAG: signal peptidase II [Verrucomicrobiota bacterium]